MQFLKGDIVYDCEFDAIDIYRCHRLNTNFNMGWATMSDYLILLDRPLRKLMGKEPELWRRINVYGENKFYYGINTGKRFICVGSYKTEFAARTAWNKFVEVLNEPNM